MGGYSHVTIEITGFCNAKCKWCKTGRRNRKVIPEKSFLSASHTQRCIEYLRENKIIEENALIDLFNFGEPFLNPELENIVRIISDAGFRIGLSTNASVYKELPRTCLKNVEYVIISMSGFSEDTYERIHGLSFNNAIKNITRFADFFNSNGFENKLIMNFHVYQNNIHEIEKACCFCNNNKIRFSPNIAYLADESLFMEYLNHTMKKALLEECSKEILFGALRATGKIGYCRQWDNLVLDDSLNVLPCCIFGSGENIRGSIFEYSSANEIRTINTEWSYCQKCMDLKQAQIVTTSQSFDYGYRNSMVTYPKVYLGNDQKQFNENDIILCPGIENGKNFSIEVAIRGGINIIRFDPIEGRNVIVENLVAECNGNLCQIVSANGELRDSGIWFDTFDPQIIIQLPDIDVLQQLVLVGKCIWY